MADNDYRSFRSRDGVAARADAPARGQPDDPLAELARLIGQSDPADDIGRDTRRGSAPAYDEPAAGTDWPADDRYAAQNQVAQDGYGAAGDQRYEDSYDAQAEPRFDERYDAPRMTDPHPAYRPAPAARDAAYEPALPGRSVEPAPRLNGLRQDARGYALAEQPRPAGDRERPDQSGELLPAFPPRSREVRYEYDDEPQEASDEQDYAMEDYEEEAPSGRKRSGLVLVAAVLGLAVLGTAGAFAYRAMFGGSILPALPPIIKADEGPNRIMPSAANAQNASSVQANAGNTGSGEKLVPREEKPVDMPAPANTAPRVVSTIPIFPAPSAGQNSGPPGAFPAPVANNVMPAPPPAVSAPNAAAPTPSFGSSDQLSVPGSSSAPPGMALPGAKKIHTVAIRPDQPDGTDAAAAAPPPPAQPSAIRPLPVRSSASAAPAAPRAAPVPQAGANAPLSIVPTPGDTAPAPAPVRTRTAVAQPAASCPPVEASPPAGGGYSVQVSSQRSEAEAQASFRALQGKFPNQLGSRQASVRRADLGDKGVYYRSLVGPFASMEQAAGMCSSLKAAGGSCIVQKN